MNQPFARTAVRPAHRRGFTLVELLIAMALLVILITIMATILTTARKLRDTAVNRVRVMTQARIALQIIRQDMTRIVPLSADIDTDDTYKLALLLRSAPGMDQPEFVNINDWGSETEVEYYLNSPDQPVTNDSSIEENFVMAFFATVGYVDSVTLERQTRLARVSYYMKRRPQGGTLGTTEGVRPGAYLIRRVEPFYWVEDPADPNMKIAEWEDPIEDNICNFVRGMRVFYADREADLDSQDVRFIEAHPEATPRPENWNEDEGTGLYHPTDQFVQFWIDQDWLTNTDPFVNKDFLPPAIMIELLVTGPKGLTVRRVSQIINLDIAPVEFPTKPGQR